MPRYIDADKLIAEYDRVHIGAPGGARKLMENAPTADVVEVVRCKDCKYWTAEKDSRMLFCSHWASVLAYSQADDFCSYGTPKERGGEK